MDKCKKINFRKWLTLLVLSLAGSLLYRLPYLREVYYLPLQTATGASNGQLGMLMSALGIFSFLLYFPGGLAADKFSVRKLITFSCLSTGMIGLCFATIPAFKIIVAIHAVWAFTTILTFWPAAIRAINLLGDSKEQGKLFGLWSLGKGLTSAVFGFVSIFIFTQLGEGTVGLKGIIIFYSLAIIILGFVSWFLIEDKKSESQSHPLTLTEVMKIVKMPKVWLAGALVFATSASYIAFGFITPYLTNFFNVSIADSAIINSLRSYVLYSVGGLCASFLADKFSSKINFMRICFVMIAVFSGVYFFMPAKQNLIYLVLVNMVALGLFVYSALATCFSIIDELGVPKELTGTTAGIISLIGFFPDTFLYSVLGNVIDDSPGIKGHQNVFLFMISISFVGLLCGMILLKLKKDSQRNSIKFELATANDVENIWTIIQNVVHSKINTSWNEQYPTREMTLGDIHRNELYVLKEADTIVSVVTLNRSYPKYFHDINWSTNTSKALTFQRFATEPSLNGKGFGAKTMEFVKKYCKEHHFEAIRIETFHENHRAINLYTRLGFKVIGTYMHDEGYTVLECPIP